MNAPNLRTIAGDLVVVGRKDMSEASFPKLETVGGDLHLALSGFTKLPDSLLSVTGNVYLTQQPKSLVESCLQKKHAGVIKGNVILVGGKILNRADGKLDYEEKAPIT